MVWGRETKTFDSAFKVIKSPCMRFCDPIGCFQDRLTGVDNRLWQWDTATAETINRSIINKNNDSAGVLKARKKSATFGTQIARKDLPQPHNKRLGWFNHFVPQRANGQDPAAAAAVGKFKIKRINEKIELLTVQWSVDMETKSLGCRSSISSLGIYAVDYIIETQSCINQAASK